MKIFNYSILILLLALGSCSDFGDLNINPNSPTAVGSETLLTSAQRSIGGIVGNATSTLYVQHISEITYTEDSRYQATRNDFSGWYSGPLADLEKIITLNTDEETKGNVLAGGSNSNQIAVARIMKAYFFHHIVDRWGPVPYSDALKGSEVLRPSYDTEEVIYDALFAELKDAAAQLDGGSISGDIILGGDTNEWKKFANTLRAVMAMRLSDKNSTKAQSEFVDAMSGGFSAVYYNYLAEAANENPWFSRFITRTDYAISNTLYDYLTASNDPRLFSYADPAQSNGEIVAMPYGLENSDFAPTDVSFPNSTYVKAQDKDIPIFSEAQIGFLMAEAAARGWISDDAETHYNTAIAASMNQWGITDATAIEEFTAQEGVKYNAENWKESIAGQKWVALFMQGYEAWAEWRRFDYPVLSPAENPLNPSENIPVRNMYPNSEGTLNNANLQSAIGLIGGTDTDGVKLFWDVN